MHSLHTIVTIALFLSSSCMAMNRPITITAHRAPYSSTSNPLQNHHPKIQQISAELLRQSSTVLLMPFFKTLPQSYFAEKPKSASPFTQFLSTVLFKNKFIARKERKELIDQLAQEPTLHSRKPSLNFVNERYFHCVHTSTHNNRCDVDENLTHYVCGNLVNETLLSQSAKEGQAYAALLACTAGANPNAKTGLLGQDTPLKVAIRSGNLEMVQLLLDNGADVNETGTSDEAPLYTAADHGQTQIVELLLKYPIKRQWNDTDVLSKNPYKIAMKKKYWEIAIHLDKYHRSNSKSESTHDALAKLIEKK